MKKGTSRHFPYPHPKMGAKAAPTTERSWRTSVYYWWWYCLRMNKAYLACCERGGTGALTGLYADFGDVRNNDFRSWWMENDRGASLFAEPVVDKTVRILAAGEIVEDSAAVLTIALPLALPKRFLLRRTRELLSAYHTRKRGQLIARESGAIYRVKHPPNVDSIEIAIRVYELHLDNPDKPQWWLANQLPRILPNQKLKPSDTAHEARDKRRALSVAANRYIKAAKKMIANTGKGEFV
jgi:hypothetical protein